MARGAIYTRVLKDGSKRYEARIRLNGKPVGKRFRRKKDAEEWADRHSTEVREGTYRELKKGTVGQYVEHWQETYLIPDDYKPSTLNSYRCVLERWLLPEFSPYAITVISSAEINRFVAKLRRKEGLSSKTVRNILNLLSKIFRDAVADNYLRHTPMEGVKKPPNSKERKGRALKPQEIRTLLDVLDAAPETRLMVLTALLTGMREGELFALRWEDIDWEKQVIRVRRQLYWKFGKYQDRGPDESNYVFINLKTWYSKRDIDLSPTLRKELRQLYLMMGSPKSGLVFQTSRGTPHIPNNVYKRKFKPAVIAAGIEGGVRFHDLRHTFGSLKLAQGSDIYYVQRQMGHSSIQVTVDIYGHQIEERRPEEAAKTDALIFG